MPRRFKFERVRTLWAEKVGTWLALDLEQWEMDHTVLTELGWSVVGWKDGEMVEDRGHFIVEENAKYYNGQYVVDRRMVRAKFLRYVASQTLDIELRFWYERKD